MSWLYVIPNIRSIHCASALAPLLDNGKLSALALQLQLSIFLFCANLLANYSV